MKKKILNFSKIKKIKITISYRGIKNNFITSCFNLFFNFYLKYNNIIIIIIIIIII